MGNVFFLCLGNPKIFELKNRKVIIRRRLGEGGFSFVELVYDPSTGREYAMKRMVCHERSEMEKAQREIDYYKMFNHPNIVKVVDDGLVPSKAQPGAQEVLCLFPVYKQGTLQHKIDELRQGKEHFDEDEIVKLIRGVCQGLKAMHHNPVRGTDGWGVDFLMDFYCVLERFLVSSRY